MSDGYNSHSSSFPWHGSGQGAGDSPAHWIVISDMCIAAYNETACLWHVYHPNGWLELSYGIDGFIDDMTQILALDEEIMADKLVQVAQTNVNLWNALINISGRALNAAKSCWSLFWWKFTATGKPVLVEPEDLSTKPLTIATEEGEQIKLHQTSTSKAVKLLGV